ncbi:hypothetical protein ACHAXM_011641 [Skeletonema potamos]
MMTQGRQLAESDDGLMRLPILTHDEVVNRRRRELRARGGDVDLDEDFERGHRHLGNSAQQLGALYQGYGTHYVDLWVGNPPQRQTAIVDTGTSATAFPCSECKNCGQHTDPPFDETKSKSFRVPPCAKDGETGSCAFGSCADERCVIAHNFGSGSDASSWTAFEAQDVVYAGGLHDRPIDESTKPVLQGQDDDKSNPIHASEYAFPLTFGCQTSVSGYFEKQLATGVFGLDRRAQSFWGQMRAAQIIHRAQFSLCYVKQSHPDTIAGSLMLGGVDKRLHKTPMVFAKMIAADTSAAFKVHVRKMYMRVGHNLVETIMFDGSAKYSMLQLSEETLNGKEKFSIDSGTTDTYFIKSISDEFRKYWNDITGLEYSNDSIPASDIDIKGLPTIILQMTPHEGGVGDEIVTDDPRNIPGLAGKMDLGTPNDVIFAIPANHYMEYNERDDTYSPRIYLDRDDSLGNVLGGNAMMGHDILFDMEAARIGFAESNCNYVGLVGELGSASVKVKDSGEKFGLKATTTEENNICSSQQCRGIFGATVTLIFIGFFVFGRRYVNGGGVNNTETSPAELEMKSNRNMRSSKYDDFEDDDEHNSSSSNNKAGSRYSDNRHSGSSFYSDRPPHKDRSSTRPDRRHHGERSFERGYGDRNLQSSSSTRRLRDTSPGSEKSVGSGESGGSGNSRGTRQSHRSHKSSQSHRSSNSHRSSHTHRSSHSRESHQSRRSSGSRQSHRTGGSSSRDVSGDRSSSSHRSSSGSHRHYSDRDSTRRSYRSYDDDYDTPLPGSIT